MSRYLFSICAICVICEPLISHADLANPADFLLPKDLYFAHRCPQIFFSPSAQSALSASLWYLTQISLIPQIISNTQALRGYRCLIDNCQLSFGFAAPSSVSESGVSSLLACRAKRRKNCQLSIINYPLPFMALVSAPSLVQLFAKSALFLVQ